MKVTKKDYQHWCKVKWVFFQQKERLTYLEWCKQFKYIPSLNEINDREKTKVVEMLILNSKEKKI